MFFPSERQKINKKPSFTPVYFSFENSPKSANHV